jgi:tRNA pseudouridine55 synthase
MNGIILVDKPQGWTSHDVVAKLRGIYQQRRIGHSGTLDPMATGVLAVFLGRGTRAVELCENDEKEYVAELLLGTVTNTQDITGEVLEQHSVDVSRAQLETVLAQFMGPQQQIPPMYSAVKIGGKKLYELARKGQNVERKPREIVIHQLELQRFDGKTAQLRVMCSKGTYIRTLCHDIGASLGVGGCLSSLRRTRAGRFSIADCVTLEEIQQAREQGTLMALLRPVDSLFAQYPALYLGEKEALRCKNGAENVIPGMPDGNYRVYGPKNEFLMLGESQNGVLRTVKSFFEVKEG